MKTDDLIDALSRDLEPAKPAALSARLAFALLGGGVVAVGALSATLGLRPDLLANLPTVLAKAAFSAALAAAALPALIRLARPGRPIGLRIAGVGAALALALAVAAVALLGEAPNDRIAAWTGGGFPWCLVIIPALATPVAALLIWLARGLAPTRLEAMGAAIGAAAGGVGAAVYAMYCPIDTIPFVATWYAVAIAFCAALGAVVGAKFLRW